MENVLMFCLIVAVLLVATCNLCMLYRMLRRRQEAQSGPQTGEPVNGDTEHSEAEERARKAEQTFYDGLANLLNYDGTKNGEADK